MFSVFFFLPMFKNMFLCCFVPWLIDFDLIQLTRASTAKVTFGRAKKAGDPYGMMMYHNNRLIEGYVHIGGQKKVLLTSTN